MRLLDVSHIHFFDEFFERHPPYCYAFLHSNVYMALDDWNSTHSYEWRIFVPFKKHRTPPYL